MPGGLSGSATWNPGSSVQRWFPELPWPTAWLARVQGRVRGWQDWPSVVQPLDPVALADRMPAFHLAWVSGVRDVSVLLGLVITELAARRIITIDETWRVSRGPQDLGAEPPVAMAGVLACLPGIDGGSAPPTVERLAGQVIRRAGGRSVWRDSLVRDPLLAVGLMVLPVEPGPGAGPRAQAAAILAPIGGRGGVATQAGDALVCAIAARALALVETVTPGYLRPVPDQGRVLDLADDLGAALLCFPELWPPVQAAAVDLAGDGPRSSGLYLADLTEVMLPVDVGGVLWT